MSLTDALGSIALFFAYTTMFAYFLQAYRMWKRKSSEDVSVLMFVYFFTGQTVFFFYGWLINNFIIVGSVIPNAIGIVTVITFALVFRRAALRDRKRLPRRPAGSPTGGRALVA